MKDFKVYFKDKRTVTIKAAKIGKIFEGMVILHDDKGEPLACYSLSEVSGVAAVDAIVAEA